MAKNVDTHRLFDQLTVSAFFAERQSGLAHAVLNYDSDELLNRTLQDVVEHLVEEFRADLPVLLRGEEYSDGIEEIASPLVDGYGVDVSHLDIAQSQMLTLSVPFSGDITLFNVTPTNGILGVTGTVANSVLRLKFQDRQFKKPELQELINKRLDAIQTNLNYIEEDIDPFNAQLRTEADRLVTERRQKLLDSRNLEADLGIRVVSRSGPGSYSIPTKPKSVTVTRTAGNSQPFRPEPVLAVDDYEETIRLVIAWGRSLERTPEVFAPLKEEHLRAFILTILNSRFEGEAGGELFNGKGRTDILVRVEDRNAFIGECKFWKGPAEFAKAIDQLLGYVVWRDSKAALILFITNKDATSVVSNAIQALSTHERHKRTIDSVDQSMRSDFVFHADGDREREIHLALLPIVIPGE